ncbi:MAG: hypothetical protein VYB09_01950 [Planctomycetota bacterium]|nr:hypothetical protein [Planctomycetota bacterium]
MARLEEDREDILQEATALVERVELDVDRMDGPLVVGFRKASGPAFFFAADPVYQFNSQGQLRRGYRQGRLLKAEAGKLIELTRERTSSSVNLKRHPLNDQQCNAYLAQLEDHLEELRHALEAGSFRVTGQVPADADVVGRVMQWLAGRTGRPGIADLPNA